jgi:RNA polymerase sigma-70 factor (ECF subfamily)
MSTLHAVSDTGLLDSFRSGNQRAFETLVRRHQARVYSTAMLLVRDQEVARDISQDTFIKFYTVFSDGRYNEEGKLLPYLLRVAHNLGIDHLRAQKKMPRVTNSEGKDIFTFLNIRNEDAFDTLESRENHEILRLAINKLPKVQQELIILRFYGKMPFKEISELTGINLNTCLGYVRNAVINLRKHLAHQINAYDSKLYPK